MTKTSSLIVSYYEYITKHQIAVKTESDKELKKIYPQDNITYLSSYDTIYNMNDVKDKIKDEINKRIHVELDEKSVQEIFILKIKKYKSSKTKREKLIIYIFQEDELVTKLEDGIRYILNDESEHDNFVECDLMNMNTALNELMLRGTGLTKKDISQLTMLIQHEYRKIEAEILDEENYLDKHFKAMVKMFYELIQAEGINQFQDNVISTDLVEKSYLVKDCYCMDVKSFKENIETSEFSDCSILEFRKMLKNKKLIKCNHGRTDYTTKDISGKAIKVIAFFKDAIEEYK